MLLDDVHQWYIVEQQFIIVNVKLHRWELERLLNQVNVAFHLSIGRGLLFLNGELFNYLF